MPWAEPLAPAPTCCLGAVPSGTEREKWLIQITRDSICGCHRLCMRICSLQSVPRNRQPPDGRSYRKLAASVEGDVARMNTWWCSIRWRGHSTRRWSWALEIRWWPTPTNSLANQNHRSESTMLGKSLTSGGQTMNQPGRNAWHFPQDTGPTTSALLPLSIRWAGLRNRTRHGPQSALRRQHQR